MRNFKLELASALWEKVKPLQGSFTLQRNWVNYLNKEFEKNERGCVLAIKDHSAKTMRTKRDFTYFRARGYCSWKGN